MILITVNGKPERLDTTLTLKRYMELHGVALLHIAIARNGVVLRHDEMEDITLSDGDWLEIVHAVGGG